MKNVVGHRPRRRRGVPLRRLPNHRGAPGDLRRRRDGRDGRVHPDDDPLVARQRRRALVGHGKDDVHRFRLGDVRRGEPGVDALRVFDPERRTGAAAREQKRARLAVVEPLVREAVAVGIARTLGAEVHALAGLHRELVRMFDPRHRRVVRLRVGLDRPVHARGEVVLIRGAPAPDRRLVARVPAAVDAEHFVLGVGPERPGLRFAGTTSASAACRARSARPSCPNPGARDRRDRCERDRGSSACRLPSGTWSADAARRAVPCCGCSDRARDCPRG